MLVSGTAGAGVPPAEGLPLRIVIAGNNLSAVLVLDLVLEFAEPAQVLCLVPPEAGPLRSWQPSLAIAAAERGVRCIQPESPNTPETVEQIRSFGAGLLLSVYYTAIFGPDLLDAVRGPCINFHPSLLPLHRGTAPLVWAIVEGDHRTGVTAHLLDEGVDTGQVLVQRPLPIHPEDTGYDLHRKAARLVAAIAAQLLRTYVATGALPDPRAQVGRTSYHSRRDPSVNHVRWSDPSRRVVDVVRALAPPLPGAYCVVGDQRVTLAKVRATPVPADRRWQPGLLSLRGDLPIVWAGDGPVQIEAVQLDARHGVVPGAALASLPGAYEGAVLT